MGGFHFTAPGFIGRQLKRSSGFTQGCFTVQRLLSPDWRINGEKRHLDSGKQQEFSVKTKKSWHFKLSLTTVNCDKPADFNSQGATGDAQLGESDKKITYI